MQNYRNPQSFDLKQELQENKWTLISIIVPAVVAPIVGVVVSETVRAIRKRKK